MPSRLATTFVLERILNDLKLQVFEEINDTLFITRAIDAVATANSDYHWVGIYILEENGSFLKLFDHYLGKRTLHTRIPIGQGVCGAAVRERQTQIVDDVHLDPRYLACSLETQSEIVVPIWRGDEVIAEIDIDSDRHAAFDLSDRRFLEQVAEILSPRIRRV